MREKKLFYVDSKSLMIKLNVSQFDNLDFLLWFFFKLWNCRLFTINFRFASPKSEHETKPKFHFEFLLFGYFLFIFKFCSRKILFLHRRNEFLVFFKGKLFFPMTLKCQITFQFSWNLKTIDRFFLKPSL